MDEPRRHALLLTATILCARKMMPFLEEDKPDMAQEFWTGHYVNRAIEQASKILEKIDEQWPSKP